MGERPDAATVAYTERRLVTVLFADLVGFTSLSEQHDPEDMSALLREYFDRARHVIVRFGGQVEKFAGDAVMAVWGARVANEDDAERAVRAGLELQEVVAKLAADAGYPDITLRVGINTGEAAVRPGGNESTGMVVGDLVNSASRLQSAADPGAVLVGEATHRAARDAIAFEDAGRRRLKGKEETITTWRALRVIAERGGRGRVEGLDPPFVGRRAELELLKDLLAAVARDGRARTVSIVGEVGIGKSRLVWELQKYADGLAEEIFWNHGRSPAYGTEGVALAALSDMLRRRLGVAENDDDDSIEAALVASLDEFLSDDPEQERLHRWLGALLCCGPSPEGDRSEFDAAARRYFAGMAAQAATVLVFEDMQWADAGLLDFVEQLADWMPDTPVLVIALARPELFERRPGWSAGRRGVVSMHLGPLSDDEMAQLIEGMMGELESGLRRDIIHRAAGVPLYAVELVRSLIGQGLVTSVDGRSVARTGLRDVALPETLQSLIGARIDRLDSPDRSLLQDAAVLGNTFRLMGLAAISGYSEAALAERLGRFIEQELIEPIRDPRSPMRGGFRFVQELVGEVARRRMSRDLRRSRHIAAARYTESLGGPDDAVVAADHYLSALSVTPPGDEADGLRSHAAEVLVSAFDRAASLYANEEVLSLGSRILDLDLDLPLERLVAINEAMATSASALLRFEEAQRRAEMVMELSHRREDPSGLRRGAALIALIDIDNYQIQPALEVLEQQLEGIDDLSADPELACLESLRARARLLGGDYEAGLASADRALRAAEELELMPVVGDALVTKATIFGIQGRVVESRLLLESVIELAERENLSNVALRAYLNLGAVVPEEALGGDPTMKAIELGRRVGNLNFTLAAWGNRAAYLVGRGEWDQADQLLADPLWESATGEHHFTRLVILGMKEGLQGEVEDARAALKALLGDVADQPERGPLFSGNASAWAANIRVLIGDTAEAQAWAQGVLGQRTSTLWNVDPLVRVLLLVGDRHQIEKLAATALERGRAAVPHHGPFVRSMVAVREGDSTSLAASEGLIAEAASRGWLVVEAIWTIGLARWLPEGHPDRARLMSQAREGITRHGLHGFARFLDPQVLGRPIPLPANLNARS